MRNAIKNIICIILIIVLTSSCSLPHNRTRDNSLNNIPISQISINEFCDYIIPYALPSNILNESFSHTFNIEDIDSFIKKSNYTKDILNSDNNYSIIRFNDSESVLFIMYNNNGEIIDSIFTSHFYSILDFSSIIIGKSNYKDVMKVDKNAYYYLKVGENYSIHWLKRGYYILILYSNDEQKKVKMIQLKKDKINFYNTLRNDNDINIESF